MDIQQIRQQYPQYNDLSDDQLGKALHSKFYADMPYDQFAAKVGLGKAGAAEDIAKTVPSSIARGMVNLVGAPADIWTLLSGGAANLAGKFTSPEFAEELKKAAKPELPLPTSKRITESLPVDLYKPQTRAGKMVGGVVEAAAPGGLFGKSQAALGAVAGLGSETAGALTDDSAAAKFVGSFAPLVAQVALAMRSTPGNMIREAAGEITPQEAEQAKQLIAAAKAKGVDLMAPEALAPSSLQQLASDVMASKEGGRVMNRFLAQRPEQVSRAVNSGLLNRVGAANTPDENMARARQAATDVIGEAESFRSGAVRPYYQAATGRLPQEQIDAILQSVEASLPRLSPASKAAAEAFRRDVMATQPIASALDDLYKTTRNKIDLPPIGATPEQRTAAGVLGPFNRQLDETLRQNSPNIREGRAIYKQITEEVIDPLTAGPVGRVAGKQGFDDSLPPGLGPISAIANEKIARPESIRELYTKLNKQDPQAFPGMARTWLENAFDQAAQKVQAGENRMAGANFVKGVYGSPQQEANFLEVMRGVARAQGKDPDDFARGAKNLMEILQSTGKVAGVGSPTGGRLPTNEMAGRNAWAASMEAISASPLKPFSRRIREAAMGSNYKAVAEILTSPNSIDRIIQIGKYKPTTTTSMALVASLLEANAEGAFAR